MVGVHTRAVFLGSVGWYEQIMDIAVLGDPLNVIPLLSSSAAIGEVLSSEEADVLELYLEGLEKR